MQITINTLKTSKKNYERNFNSKIIFYRKTLIYQPLSIRISWYGFKILKLVH